VVEAELQKRRAALPSLPSGAGRRGYDKLYFDTVTQAEQGCDFDFAIPEITKRVP
jgi:dihydroxy-acid dehydratase